MYIDPFWAGVLSVIFAEITALIIAIFVTAFKRTKR